MKIKIIISNRSGKFYAEGIYDGERVVVKRGGHINPNFAESIRGGKLSRQYRADKKCVSDKYEIVSDCVFKSPSTAAQFVTGRSVDGYNAWKLESGETLGEYLKEKGLR